MKTSEFDYSLPDELIAQRPAPRRGDSRLMVLRRSGGWEHRRFADLDALLGPGDVLVLNDTRVLPARLELVRPTGGRAEAVLLRREGEARWEALLGRARRLRTGDRLALEDGTGVTLGERRGEGVWRLDFDREPDLEGVGRMPLPPYIRRAADDADRERYQTVYADKAGAVAAPTAGLHFTREHLERLQAAGVKIARVTLHVGLGTFRPVTVEDVASHRMHEEAYDIPPDAQRALRAASRVVAVGTTSCRALETWAATGRASGATDLFIVPGHRFRCVGALVTNFHIPKSTLVMLVSAFAGRENLLAAYAEAVRERYQFFSYGDSMVVL